MRLKVNAFMKKPLIKNVITLFSGAALAQAITLLALPILTRLYSPENFTVLASFTSLLALLSAVACLRFEIAIPIPNKQEQALHLLYFSIISVIGITIITCLCITFGSNWINQVTNQRLKDYLWLLPLTVFLSGLYNALQYWMTREGVFKIVAKTRVSQSISGASAQIGFGYLGLSPIGLLLGVMLNSGIGIVKLLRFFYKNYKSIITKVSYIELKRTFKLYNRFPKYSTFEALTNNAGIQVPVLIIAALALGEEAGYLMLAMRLLSAPMGLLGGAISQVFLTEASDKYNAGELTYFTNKTIIMLAKISIIPLLLIGVISPMIIPLIFGDQWERTGVLISWMVPWFFLQFIVSPVSMVLHITDNQRIALLLQIFGFILRAGSVWLAIIFLNSWATEIFAITSGVFYFLYIMVVLNIANKTKTKANNNL